MSKIKNLDRLLAKLDAAGTQAAPIMEKGVKKGTKLIQGSAKDLCPEDTGALRNSIRTRTEIKENIVTGDVYTNKAYAAYVEFGTGQRGEAAPKELPDGLELHYKQDWKGMAPQPYLYRNNGKAGQMKCKVCDTNFSPDENRFTIHAAESRFQLSAEVI